MSIPLPPHMRQAPPQATKVEGLQSSEAISANAENKPPATLAPYDPPGTAIVQDTKMSLDETEAILDMELIPQHRADPNIIRFIKNYLLCRDINQAARESGLKPRDGQNLRRRPDIHQAIVKITDAAVFKHGYDAAEVVERVKEIAGIDPVELENPDGTFKKSLTEIPAQARRAIKKFKAKNIFGIDPNGMRTVVGELIEVEFWDKMKAVELLGREKEMFKESKKVTHDISNNMRDTLLESKKRADEFNRLREVGAQAQLEHKSIGQVLDITPVGDSDDN